MAVNVTLDIYSGRENPKWSLERREINELGQRLRQLHEQTNQLPHPPALGYRGFHLNATHEKMPSNIRVFEGIIQTESANFRDHDRALEKWLVHQSRGRIDSSTYDYLESVLGK